MVKKPASPSISQTHLAHRDPKELMFYRNILWRRLHLDHELLKEGLCFSYSHSSSAQYTVLTGRDGGGWMAAERTADEQARTTGVNTGQLQGNQGGQETMFVAYWNRDTREWLYFFCKGLANFFCNRPGHIVNILVFMGRI